MIIDNHVHVGWFTDGYHTPREIWNSAMAAGIDGMVVSSTSTCAELYKDVCRELRELIRLGGTRVHPILWLTPRMLKLRYSLPYMLHSKIRWQGVKLHFGAHPEWAHNTRLLHRALGVAARLDVPVLLHTGSDENCRAGCFMEIIRRYDTLTFVLAHGRPVDETIEVMTEYPNAYTDTAFMPTSDIKKIAEAGLKDRILFGTDTPINKVFFRDMTTTDFIRKSISALQSVLGQETEMILSRCIYT